MLVVLVDTPHVRIICDPLPRIVSFVRTAEPIETLVPGAGREVVAAFDRIDRGGHGLLLDLRLAPMRDDTIGVRYGLEPTVMFAGFRRRAILVASAVGELQVGRRLRSGDAVGEARVFRDEARARAYLQATSSEGR